MAARRLVSAIAVACLWATTGPASANDPNWAAQWVTQSPYLFLESGQVAQSQFTAKNIGAQTWTRNVRLGTVQWPYTAPPDRASPFFVPNDWITENRPALLDQASVPPQGTGTFTFRVRAPNVGAVTEFQEHFAPVNEGVAWMGCNGCTWDNVYLVYRVFPPEDPTVTITSAPRTATIGDPIDVTADASDNLAVNRVVFALDDQQIIVNAPPYKARFSSVGLASGSHLITARAYDNAGHQDSDVASLTLHDPPAGQGPPAPPTSGTPLPPVGVSINEAALYTNNPLVRLRLRPPPGATGVLVSNDGGFSDARSTPINGEETHSWTLPTTGAERLPKTVHVRFIGGGVDESKDYTDDIILDQTPPQVLNVHVERRGNRRIVARRKVGPQSCAGRSLVMRVGARDASSGLLGLTYGFRPSGLGTIVKFKPRIVIKAPLTRASAKAMYVRVSDGATNLSKRRKVSLRGVCG
jgi:hypothetical protein